MAKEFLSQKKIHFVEKDINVDEQARAELIRRKINSVPTFMIGEDIVIGLDKAKILQLVDHRVVECEKCHGKMRVPIDKGEISVSCPNCDHKFNIIPNRL